MGYVRGRICAKCNCGHVHGHWREMPKMSKAERRKAGLKAPDEEWICKNEFRKLPAYPYSGGNSSREPLEPVPSVLPPVHRTVEKGASSVLGQRCGVSHPFARD